MAQFQTLMQAPVKHRPSKASWFKAQVLPGLDFLINLCIEHCEAPKKWFVYSQCHQYPYNSFLNSYFKAVQFTQFLNKSTPRTPHLIRFFDVMRGTRTAAPTKLLPVMKMPLYLGTGCMEQQLYGVSDRLWTEPNTS